MKTNRKSDFNEHVMKYDRWYERNRPAYLSETLAVQYLIPKGKGLEIGVNTGRFASVLGIPFGLDPAGEGLKIAESRGVSVILGVGEDIPLKNETLDYVLMVITISFLKRPEKVFREVSRVLKKKGKIIVGIVDKNSFLGESYQEKKSRGLPFYKDALFFSPSDVMDMLSGCGFRDTRIYQTLFQLPEKVKKVQKPKKGHGEGGFVVMGAEKGD